MTRERLNHLLDLIDEVNSKVYVSASLEHGLNDDNIFVSLYYQGPKAYKSFNTFIYSESYDKDLVKGEAYLRGLLAKAETNPKASREAWENGVYQG